MSDQSLDLRRSAQIVRGHKLLVGIFAALGLAAGVMFTMRNPPMLASQALVVLPPSVRETRTQEVIANSDHVLSGALSSADLKISLQTLHRRITVGSLAFNVISITAQGTTAAQAERTANAVARSYVRYLGQGTAPFGQGGMPFRAVPARVLQPAAEATGTPLAIRMLVTGGLGILGGLLAGSVLALAIGRADRRLRERDDIAEAIGVPVLASIKVSRPSGTADWRKLLEKYEPGAVHAWHLRRALQHLALDGGLTDGEGSGSSLAVLSLSCDRRALALGPQLATFAASMGISTTLVIGPGQDPNAAATLRAACAAWPPTGRSRNLHVAVRDHGDAGTLPDGALAIVVAVVDGAAPQVADTMRATATVLGVSSGAATAEQLARVATSAAAAGRPIAGIFVADPDPADHSTGRPQPARPARRTAPTRVTGTPTGARW